MKQNVHIWWSRTEKILRRVLPFYLDVLICLALIIPLYIQWMFWYFFQRKQKSVRGKTALITGAAQGLGRAMSIRLAELGCNVAIADVNKALADETCKKVSQLGVKAKSYKVDVTKVDDILQLRSDVKKDFGNVDILINNAGIISVTNLEEDPSHLSALVNVNLLGTILMTKYFLEDMKEQGSGHIVSISSMGGIHASPFIITYSATKFGVNGFMQGLNEHLRLENFGDKIKTTCIFPYYIKTQSAINEFLNPNIRMKAMSVEKAAKEAVEAILWEKVTATLPGSHELAVKFVNLFPLRIQQKLYRDRALREYEFKDPDFRR